MIIKSLSSVIETILWLSNHVRLDLIKSLRITPREQYKVQLLFSLNQFAAKATARGAACAAATSFKI
jgi:hypothetical protein